VSVLVALTIAGSDPSGGAGMQADLKTFSALGVFGTSVVTALTAQNTMGVTAVHEVPAGFVTEQLETLTADVRIDAVKLGMLANAEVIDAVAAFLDRHSFEHVVLDPVMVSTSGHLLLKEDAVDALRRLIPLASIVTPNIPEAAVLLGASPAPSVAQMRSQAADIRTRWGARVLLTGGHLGRAANAVDVFAGPEGERLFTAPRVPTRNTHGTGCSLSSALAALRPQREDWLATVQDAKAWLTEALAAADGLAVGHGNGPIHHFFDTWHDRDRRTDRGTVARGAERDPA
jgi:hydroxymethylpyrimidine/phosphomethylpyrimidine kinase